MTTRTKTLDLLALRGHFAPVGVSYEHTPGQFGLDVTAETLQIDEARMAVRIPFADGNRRDGVGDLLEIGGIDLSRHRVNPIVLYDHGKAVTLPVAVAADPDSGEYTVELDVGNRKGAAWSFFYQGKGLANVDRDREYDHAVFCQQLFDLMVKKFVRGGSIGYTVIAARELGADPDTGTPKGLHLLAVKMLELSAVVLPANQDTAGKSLTAYRRAVADAARRILSLPKVAGKPLSNYLVKSLSPYSALSPAKVTSSFGQPATRAGANDVTKAPERGEKSLGSIRRKYKNVNELRRKISHGRPGSGVLHVSQKDLDKLKQESKSKKVKFSWLSELPGGHHKVKLIGSDDLIDDLAKTYGLPMKRKGAPKEYEGTPDEQYERWEREEGPGKTETNEKIRQGTEAAAKTPKGRNKFRAFLRGSGTQVVRTSKRPNGDVDRSDDAAAAQQRRTAANSVQDDGRGVPKPAAKPKQEAQPKQQAQPAAPKYVIGRFVEPGGSDESNKAMRTKGFRMHDHADHTTWPYGAQCLKRLHDDHSLTLADYDGMHGDCEHPHVRNHIHDELQHKIQRLDALEKAFSEHYPDLPPLGHGGGEEEDEIEGDEVPDDLDEEVAGEEAAEEEDAEDDGYEGRDLFDDAEEKAFGEVTSVGATSGNEEDEDEPTEEEAYYGQVKSIRERYKRKAMGLPPTQGMIEDDIDGEDAPNMEAIDEQAEGDDGLCPECAGEAEVDPMDLASHEHDMVKNAADYLRRVGADDSPFEDEHRMEAYHHHKCMDGIWQKGMSVFKTPEEEEEGKLSEHWQEGKSYDRKEMPREQTRRDSHRDQSEYTRPKQGTDYATRELTQRQGKITAVGGTDSNNDPASPNYPDGAKSMHPHRASAGHVGGFFKRLSAEIAFGHPHREEALRHLKSLEDVDREITERMAGKPKESEYEFGEDDEEEVPGEKEVPGEEGHAEPDGDEFPGIEMEGDGEPDGDEVPADDGEGEGEDAFADGEDDEEEEEEDEDEAAAAVGSMGQKSLARVIAERQKVLDTLTANLGRLVQATGQSQRR